MSYKPYPAYKESGVEWLREIPEGWAKTRLRFLAKLNPSKNELGTDHPAEISFLPMDNIGDDGTLRLDTIRKWSEVESGYSYFSEGDISYAIITPCFENGKGAQMVGLYNGCGFGTTELCILRPQKTCDGRWLWYLTTSEPFRKIGESYMYGAGGQKRVPDDFARNFSVGIPPLQTQKAIAAFLDTKTARIDSLIQDYEELVSLLKEKRQALVSHAVTRGLSELVSPDDPEFGEWAQPVAFKDSGVEWLREMPKMWEVKPLKYTCIYLCRGSIPSYVEESDIHVVNQATFSSGIFDLKKARFHNPEDRTYQDSIIKNGDVLLASTGGGVLGKTCYIENISGVFFADTHVTILRFSNLCTAQLVYYFFSCNYDLLNGILARGSTNQIEIERASLQNLEIALPPLPTQKAIAAYLDRETAKFDALVAEAEGAIELLKERRSALITAAVTGKINVEEMEVV